MKKSLEKFLTVVMIFQILLLPSLSIDGYQRVIVAFVKEATKENAYAATVAAPLFERIAEKTLIHDKVV